MHVIIHISIGNCLDLIIPLHSICPGHLNLVFLVLVVSEKAWLFSKVCIDLKYGCS